MSRPTASELRALALCVGKDLDGLSEAEIATKVRECPDCREHWLKLRSSQEALREAGEGCDLPHDSIWDGVEPKLKSCVGVRAARSSWLQATAATAVAVAGLAMIGNWSGPAAAPGGVDIGFGPRADGNGLTVDRRTDADFPLRREVLPSSPEDREEQDPPRSAEGESGPVQ